MIRGVFDKMHDEPDDIPYFAWRRGHRDAYVSTSGRDVQEARERGALLLDADMRDVEVEAAF